jgi:hypothetical protein
MGKSSRNTASRCGSAAVELAVLLPVLTTIVLGTLELGRALEVRNILLASVREGGRLAAMDWEGVVPSGVTPGDKVISDIRNFIDAAAVPGDKVSITLTSADGPDAGQSFSLADPNNTGRLFRVTVSIPYESVSYMPVFFMKGRNLAAVLVLRAGNISTAT